MAAALCLLLGGVWLRAWWQIRADSNHNPSSVRAAPPSEAAPPAGRSRPATPAAVMTSPPSAAAEEGEEAPYAMPGAWPAATLAALLVGNPFSRSETVEEASLPSVAVQTPELPLSQRLATEDAVVMVAGADKRFLLGEDEYRVGDRLSGLIIEDITAGAIVLAPE
jgi:hypothetical protein